MNKQDLMNQVTLLNREEGEISGVVLSINEEASNLIEAYRACWGDDVVTARRWANMRLLEALVFEEREPGKDIHHINKINFAAAAGEIASSNEIDQKR